MSILKDTNLQQLLAKNREEARQKWGQDIHSIIYRAPAGLAAVILLQEGDTAEMLERSCRNVSSFADCTIIAVISENKGAINEAGGDAVAGCQWIRCSTINEVFTAACAAGAGEYQLWLFAGEYFSDTDLRKVNGLKAKLDQTVNAVQFQLAGTTSPEGEVVVSTRCIRANATCVWNADIGSWQLQGEEAGLSTIQSSINICR